MKEKICLALDVNTILDVRKLVSQTKDYVGMYKVGLELFTTVGRKAIEEIQAYNAKVFLDLKFHDIPTTVKKAAIEATAMNVNIFNLHTLGGSEMMKMTADAVTDKAIQIGIERPKILGVTVLTSMSQNNLECGLLVERKLEDYVLYLASEAFVSNLDGVVSSPLEVPIIKNCVSNSFICLTPGIRPPWTETNDQQRFTTPKEAIELGSDYIVIGRPITEAKDPGEAAYKILQELLGI